MSSEQPVAHIVEGPYELYHVACRSKDVLRDQFDGANLEPIFDWHQLGQLDLRCEVCGGAAQVQPVE